MAYKKLTTVDDETIYQITTNSLQNFKISVSCVSDEDESDSELVFYAYIWDPKKFMWKLFMSEPKRLVKTEKDFIEKVNLILKDD